MDCYPAADTRAADCGPHEAEPAEAEPQAESREAGAQEAGPHGTRPHEAGPREAGPHSAAPRRQAASGGQPPPGWPGQFAQVLAETLAGSRPPRQLVPWTTQQARTHIRRLGAQLSAAERPRIRRVITSRPASDVVEMAVIVGFGPRVRALAVRLEQAGPTAAPGRPARPPRWVCTAVEAA
ncbi:MAG: Rv3235 family protein [Gemmatimonadota bacterium]